MTTVIVKNVTNETLPLSLGLDLRPKSSMNLIKRFDIEDISEDQVLKGYVSSKKCVINDGVKDLSVEDGLKHISIESVYEDDKGEAHRVIVTIGFNFVWYNTTGNKKGYPRANGQGNGRKSLAAESSSDINNVLTWPRLLLNSREIFCYPMNHPKVLKKLEWGYSNQGDPCIITENKQYYFIYIEVESDTGYGIVKVTHPYNAQNAPWNDPRKEVFIIGIINPNWFPTMLIDDIGYNHRECCTTPNPHMVKLSQTIDFNLGEQVAVPNTSTMYGRNFLTFSAGCETDKKIIVMCLDAYKQSTPAFVCKGSMQIEPSYYQRAKNKGSSLLMKTSTGKLCSLEVIDRNGTFSISITPI